MSRMLVVERDTARRDGLVSALTDAGFRPKAVSLAEVAGQLASHRVELLLVGDGDLRLLDDLPRNGDEFTVPVLTLIDLGNVSGILASLSAGRLLLLSGPAAQFLQRQTAQQGKDRPRNRETSPMFDLRKSAAAALAAAALGGLLGIAPAEAQTLKVVMHSDVKILDPIWTTAYIQRNHGYMVWDTLFAVDEKFDVKPQMVDKWTVSPDNLTWTFTLRDGLEWHDGKPVTAEDCVASIKRWAARDSMGQKLTLVLQEYKG